MKRLFSLPTFRCIHGKKNRLGRVATEFPLCDSVRIKGTCYRPGGGWLEKIKGYKNYPYLSKGYFGMERSPDALFSIWLKV